MTTNNTIPPEMWDQNKESIIRLYRDEDLPLKLVIRRLRNGAFNPRLETSAFQGLVRSVHSWPPLTLERGLQ